MSNTTTAPPEVAGRWVPVRTGDTFCSPACGGGCRFAEYELRCRETKAVADRLGAGWVCEVKENLGWHGSVTNKVLRLQVFPSGSSLGYTAIFAQRWCGRGATPEEAIRDAANESVKVLADDVKCYRIACNLLGLSPGQGRLVVPAPDNQGVLDEFKEALLGVKQRVLQSGKER